jgi:DNA-directed RNA polymerase specialized sigma24 family protein
VKVELQDDVVAAASRGEYRAMATIATTYYPLLCRVAVALNGEQSKSLGVVQQLLTRLPSAAAAWLDTSDPVRWFTHHLVLDLRQLPASPDVDPLVRYSANKSPSFVAFIRALRHLPRQQVEAFVLNHGEGLSDRDLAVAMDCSVTAATNHLAAADQSMRLVAADAYSECLGEFKTAYDRLSPDSDQVRQYVTSQFARRAVRKTSWRWLKRTAIALIILAIAYALWRAFRYMSA